MARLRFVTDVDGVNTIELVEHTITVGRDHNNLARIADPGISKNHALLIRDGYDYRLFDLHSANGTWVNDERITVMKLKDGDVLRFGHLELRYETAAAKTTTGGVQRPALVTGKPAMTPPAPAQVTPAAPVAKPKSSFGPPPSTLKSGEPTTAPKRLASASEQPVMVPKKLAGESTDQASRIRLKRD